MAFAAIFGDSLLTKDGERPTEEVLQGKGAVALYFSAHWCPPCRGFTPKLANMYNDAFKGKGLEIVFVSSDKNEEEFTSYFGEQPWCALPFAKRDIKEALSKKYKVQGIPSLVILGPDGSTITTDGREAVSKDPTGAKFPWTPPTPAEKAKAIVDSIGPDLIGKAGGRAIGLYFSAHWCPPCRGFTPKLVEYYNNGLKDKIEIIFVSSDRDEKSFNEYFGEMPWLALPFSERERKDVLSGACGVDGIPAFAILSPDGTIITTDGRAKVTGDPTGENFPEAWLPSPFNDVNEDNGALNEEECVLAMGANEATFGAVKSVAQEYYEKAGRDVSAMPMRFFKAPAGQVTDQIRKLTKLTGDKLVFLDIPSSGAFYVCDKDATDASAVREFIASVKAGTEERQQLG